MEQYDFKHFENSLGLIYCTIRHNERLKMVSVTWKGTAQESDIEIVKDEALKIINRNETEFLMNDFQDLFSASTEVLRQFIRSAWDQEVLATGVKFIVHIIKTDMEIPLLSDDESISRKFFYHKLDAVEWIEKQLGIIE
jgi:hypothetical protein